MIRRGRASVFEPVLWVEIPVWLTFAVCVVLWLSGQMSWWVALLLPIALEVVLFAPVWAARVVRRRQLLRRYPRLRGGV